MHGALSMLALPKPGGSRLLGIERKPRPVQRPAFLFGRQPQLDRIEESLLQLQMNQKDLQMNQKDLQKSFKTLEENQSKLERRFDVLDSRVTSAVALNVGAYLAPSLALAALANAIATNLGVWTKLQR